MFFDYQSVKSAPPEALERTNKNARVLPKVRQIQKQKELERPAEYLQITFKFEKNVAKLIYGNFV